MEITLNEVVFKFFEVPEGATAFRVLTNLSLPFFYSNKYGSGCYNALPMGRWRIQGISDNITETQAEKIIERRNGRFKNYLTEKYTATTAKKSLLSLLRYNNMDKRYVILNKQ